MDEQESKTPPRYAIVTDIHANWHALEAVVNAVRAENSLSENQANPYRFWFLGDIIGYGPHPVECLYWLRDKSDIGDRWVPGNHDMWLINPDGVSDDAKDSLGRHRALLAESFYSDIGEWFRSELVRATAPDPALEGIEKNIECRSRVKLQIEDWTLLFVHASLFDTRRRIYLEPWKKIDLEKEFGEIRKRIDPGTNAILFCGHAHYPLFAHWLNDASVALRSIRYYTKLEVPPGLNIINPGSVGQPRDGDPRAAYALFDGAEKTIEFRRVAYDVQKSVDALAKNGYSESLRNRLLTGDGMDTLALLAEGGYRRPKWDLEAVDSPSPGVLPEDKDDYSYWDGRR